MSDRERAQELAWFTFNPLRGQLNLPEATRRDNLATEIEAALREQGEKYERVQAAFNEQWDERRLQRQEIERLKALNVQYELAHHPDIHCLCVPELKEEASKAKQEGTGRYWMDVVGELEQEIERLNAVCQDYQGQIRISDQLRAKLAEAAETLRKIDADTNCIGNCAKGDGKVTALCWRHRLIGALFARIDSGTVVNQQLGPSLVDQEEPAMTDKPDLSPEGIAEWAFPEGEFGQHRVLKKAGLAQRITDYGNAVMHGNQQLLDIMSNALEAERARCVAVINAAADAAQAGRLTPSLPMAAHHINEAFGDPNHWLSIEATKAATPKEKTP